MLELLAAVAAVTAGAKLARRLPGLLPPPTAPQKSRRELPRPARMPLFTPYRGAHLTTRAAAGEAMLTVPGPFFELAGLLWPVRQYLNKVIFLTGRPGTGKTTMKKMCMASVARLFALVSMRMRWVVLDPSNGYLPYLYQILPDHVEIIRATPPDAAGWRWDVAADVTNDTLNEAFQTALFPDALFKGAGDPFWYRKAREVTEAIVNVFHDRESPWTFSDLIVPIKYPQFLRPLLAQSPRTVGKAKHELVGKLGRDIVTTSSSVMNRMATAAAQWQKATNTFSCRSFLNGQSQVLHFGYRPDMIPALASIANALTYMLILIGMERDDEWNHTFLWGDESRFLNGLTGLELLSARGRGSGFGGFFSGQGTPGLFASWGKDRVEEFLDVVSAWVTFGAGHQTARAFSQFVGQVEGLEQSYGHSLTTSETHSLTTGTGTSWHWKSGTTYSTNRSTSSSNSRSTSSSENFKLTLKDAVLPSEVTNLGQATAEEDRLSGFAFNPGVGAFRFDTSFMSYFEYLAPPPFAVMPVRPDSDQVLMPWTEADLKRLGLDLTPELIKALRVTWGHTGGVS